MFGTQDALIQQHAGVATVCPFSDVSERLVSTLGNKFSHKRISKKEIQAVSIPQTCDVIKNPPKPIALRLTSNLLYGVTLIYRLKTDYLNSDTAAIKTKVQKDLFNQNNNKNLLITDQSVDFNKFLKDSARNFHLNYVNTNQGLLTNDPSFNINSGLLPSLNGLHFLGNTQLSDTPSSESKRKIEIRKADFANNIASIVTSSQTNQEIPKNFESDELDADNPEFAFDEDGLLFSLQEEFPRGFEKINEDESNYDLNLDFDFDFDKVSMIQTPNSQARNQDSNQLGQILEELDDAPFDDGYVVDSLQKRIEPPNNKKQKKKRSRADSHDIVIDDYIGLLTDDLRSFRDNYVSDMLRINQRKKQRKKSKLSVDELLTEINIFTPIFPKSNELLERGRSRIRTFAGDEEDFVDGLWRHRRSSGSIEVGRRGSSSRTRRSSRGSISEIKIPIIQVKDESMVTYDADFNYAIDFDDKIIDGVGDTSDKEEKSSKKRSSSITVFDPVEEDVVMDFNDFHEDFQEDFAKVPCTKFGIEHDNSEDNQSIIFDNDQIKDLTIKEIEAKYGKKTLKFLNFIDTRLEEEEMDELTFESLLDGQEDISIVVKSFYEILQLATLNKIKIDSHQPKDRKLQMMKPYEFSVSFPHFG